MGVIVRVMGRLKTGPVRLNNGQTWYCRLFVPKPLRERAGKTRLVRSLETTEHTEALKRYGPCLRSLEDELRALLAGEAYRRAVSDWSGPYLEATDIDATDATQQFLGVKDLDPGNPQHVEVFTAIQNATPISITWEEAIDLWIRVRNRGRARPLADGSVQAAVTAIDQIRKFGDPATLTKAKIREYIAEMEVHYSSMTVATRFRMIQGVMNILMQEDKIETNPFLSVTYTATRDKEEEKRAYTDEELILVKSHLPLCYQMVLTGLRPGELASRLDKDIDGDMLVIDDQPCWNWRPKTLSSYRRVPIYPSFRLDYTKRRVNRRRSAYSEDLRKLIKDPLCTPHSGRHTFYELSRRADCNPQVIEVIAGHAKKEGSRSAAKYGGMPDTVLKREIQKVWDLAESITAVQQSY